MELAIQSCQDLFSPKPIRIGAQTYATKFYESLGIVLTDDSYDEDGISISRWSEVKMFAHSSCGIILAALSLLGL
jgi:predicted GNAT family N-acyltransferase